MNSPILKKLLPFCGAAIAIWLGSRYLLPIALPFLLAGLLAYIAEPLVRTLHTGLHIKRTVASLIGISMALLCAVVLVLCLCALALRQLSALSGILPNISSSTVSGLTALKNSLLELSNKTPDNIRTVLDNSVENLFSDSTRLVNRVVDGVLSIASGVLTRIPDSALGFGTWILASFMISIKLPVIRTFLRQRIPQVQQQQFLDKFRHFRKNICSWLIAQTKLICITFAVLTCGFLLLRISYAPLWAGLISLIDALPILGSGTVLIPWSLVHLLQGDIPRALGLLGVWGIAALLRTVLEPRLVGKQLGLDPLITLLAMYTGYRLWGIIGMILSPLLAVTLLQLCFTPAKGEKP